MDGDGRRHAGNSDAVESQPPMPPSPSGGTFFRVLLIAALALLLLAPPAAIAYTTVRSDRTTVTVGQELSGDGGHGAGGPGDAANPAAAHSASPGASRRSAPATVAGKIRLALEDQGAALLAGDEDAFLAVVDPSAAVLREDLARRFGSLRQLRVKLWHPVPEGRPKTEAGGTATVKVLVNYCFVVPTCDPMALQTTTRWNVSGRSPTLLEFGVAKDLGPRPWEVSELRSAVGARVVMSTTAKYASRLPSMLAAAEKAAALADTFARWGEPPARYVVYLAGPDEWSAWYGIKQEPWVAGFALPLTASVTEIVLNAARVDAKQTLDVLRHEFTHVVTLAGVEKAYEHTWWLVEGIAEYVRVKGGGKPFDGAGAVRGYVRSGRWKGEIAMDDPPGGSSTVDVSGRYGVAYLSLQRLADRFGEDRLMDFFDYAARQGLALGDAAPKAFGVSWDDVEADCVRNVRGRV
ncbi:basic secretory protein-like protein [Dactylosporangium sp. NPDC051484]|uniref:basic secretory protein-like protein n=1 Tax=Dactylosporangium sp. NPDC051484 TaxID=3154942 RepID=UPI00345031E8